MDREVVVTGIGITSSLGDKQATVRGLLNGESAIGYLPEEFHKCPTRIGGIVSGVDVLLQNAFTTEARKITSRWSKPTHFALLAAREALAEEGANLLDDTGRIIEQYQGRTGTAIGTGIGPSELISELATDYAALPDDRESPAYTSAMKAIKKKHLVTAMIVLPDSSAFGVSLQFGAKGPMECGIKACATGAGNIRRAAMEILFNTADIMIAGGCESLAVVDILAFNLLGRNGALSRRNQDPTHASRPCDQGHDGFVGSEGAGIFILEERQHAIDRGPEILAELVGFGETSDGAGSTDPSIESQIECIGMALKMAQETSLIEPRDIYLIKAHSTSTPAPRSRNISADGVELNALWEVFGNSLLPRIPIVTAKALLGHTLGASGSLESGLIIESLRQGKGFGNPNLENPIAEARGLRILKETTSNLQGRAILCNSFGFGGQNVALVFRTAA